MQTTTPPLNTDEDEAQRIAQLIYEGKWNGKSIDKKLTKKIADILLKEFTQATSDINTSIPEDIYQQLKTNIYHFSAAKNYNHLLTLSKAVYNPNTGQKTSFKQFKEVANTINQKYNKYWLRTEQNFAYASTQMVAKWHNFDNDANLKYKTANDSRVRHSHAVLNNLVYPKNHAFWNTHYPPNDWGCRCNVIETNDNPNTNTPPQINIPKIFQTNTAKQNIIFPKNHPYFTNAPKDILTQAEQLQAEQLFKKQQNETLKLPREQQFITIKTFKNGGHVLQHLNVDTKKTDFQTLEKIATQKAKQGNKVEILPEIHFKETETRNLILPNYNKHPKNPDLKINNEYYEVENTEMYDNIAKRISAAYKQADNVIIVYEDDLGSVSQKLIYKMFKAHKELKQIEIIAKNKTEVYKRETK